MAQERWEGIWVWLEVEGDRPLDAGLEVLGMARELVGPEGEVVAVAMSARAGEAIAREAVRRGADRVLVVEDPAFDPFTPEAFTDGLEGLVRERRPSILLFPATPNGTDLAGRLAVRLRTGLIAHAVRGELREDGVLAAYVPGFGGRALAAIACTQARPQMVTIPPGVFPVPPAVEGRSGRIERVQVPPPRRRWTRVVEREVAAAGGLATAERVVAVGMGVASDLEPARRLAERLGAQMGATRPVIDLGLMPRETQIGTTGVSVRPRLLIALGISGAVHFTAGIEGAETVIAVNLDPEAPIFEEADYGVLGDAFPFLEALLAVLEADRTAEATPEA